MLQKLRIAFLGGGNMTRYLVSGLINESYPRQNIIVSNRGQQKLLSLVKDFDIIPAESNSKAVEAADLVILSVKPQFIKDVCLDTAEAISIKKPLIISLATATRINDITTLLGVDDLPVIRIMTNLSVSVGKGTTAMYANPFVTMKQRTIAESIFNATGNSLWLATESDLNTYTALIGCSPAYLFILIEAMEKAAESRGIPKALATKIAIEAVYGASELAKSSTIPIRELRQKITTPNGVTEHSLKPIIAGNYFKLFEQAFEQAENRCHQIEEANRVNVSDYPSPKL